MALEAIQAQAGHRSIETTHSTCTCRTSGWPTQYARAISLIDTSVFEAVAQ